jgi:hypothetical protein
VQARDEGDRLVIEVTSDAAVQPGPDLETALVDVTDRTGALGGHLRVHPAASGVITIRAEIPCES